MNRTEVLNSGRFCVSSVERECRSDGALVFIYSNDGSERALGGRSPAPEVLPAAARSNTLCKRGYRRPLLVVGG